ncbi:uncharacterized protein LOC117889778 [Drosophila subobscura]|uniref:uncharacterized protein LOC117889778 n=1 Tax=Drosophila subobscura TaxID=7241 RepID=UPI00155A5751|nr:uncharacterized protein LOC117889778 [Drosophila subobscura]
MKKDSRGVVTHYDNITHRCHRILSGKWNLICSDRYPMDVLIRYGGKLVAPGDHYAVFQSENEHDDFLAVFRSRAIVLCKSLRIKSMQKFECIDGDGATRLIEIGHSHLVCVEYAFRLVDELVEHCTNAKVDPNKFSALYYANIEIVLNKFKTSCGLALSSNILVVIASALVLIFVILHWR